MKTLANWFKRWFGSMFKDSSHCIACGEKMEEPGDICTECRAW